MSKPKQTQAWYTNTMYYSFYKRVQTNDSFTPQGVVILEELE